MSDRVKLTSMQVPGETAKVVDERIGEVLQLHIKRISAAVPLSQQMRSLAFDAYTQGLLDGAQIGAIRALRAQEKGAPQGPSSSQTPGQAV